MTFRLKCLLAALALSGAIWWTLFEALL